MLLTIGPAGRYLIMALIFLIVLGGGTYLVYRSGRRSSGQKGRTAAGGTRGDRGAGS